MSATLRFVPTGWWHALTTTKEADESRDGRDEPKVAAWRQLKVSKLLCPVCTACVGHSALTSTLRICAFVSRSAKAETCAKICAIPLTLLEFGYPGELSLRRLTTDVFRSLSGLHWLEKT